MPPKRKTAAASAATAGTSTTNPPARKRGRPPIIRNNEANVSDTQPQPKRQRMTMDDVEASQDSDPQTLSDRTHDVDAASQAQDISTDHTRSVVASDLEQKGLHLPLSHPDTETAAPTDGEDDGELSTGMSKGTSESPAKKARGAAQRRGKGVLPATRSSPRKQTHPQLHTRQQQQHDDDEGSAKVMNESFPRSSQPPPVLPSPLSIPSSSALPLSLPTLPIQMTNQQQQQPIKRKRGRPPKATTTSTGVADSQSLINQPAVTAKSSEHQEQTRLPTISITATPATSERKEAQTSGSLEHSAAAGVGLSNSGGDASGVDSTGAFVDVDEDEDEDDAPGIVPSQSASVSNQTTAVPDDVPTQQQQQQQGIHRLPPPTSEHHQATVSSGLDIPTHPHSHQHIHPHPSSLYPPSMPYPYPYAHHGTPSGHYPFTHPPHHPPPAGRPYSASESGEAIDYSPSFPSTVPTTPGNSFTSTYPHHSHPHPHAILDTNAPHGNPFPPPGAGHIGIPNYAQSVYAVPPPVPSPALPTDSDEHEENETQLGLASSISVNGGGKRKVVSIPSHGGKSGGRAGRGDHVACHFCRGRKLKCDGRRPTCGHCILRNLACAYDDFIRRRGPGKKEKNSKRNHKALHSAVDDADSQDQSRDQNMMLIGPDLAGPGGLGVEVGLRAGAAGVAGPSNQTEVLVTVPSQGQPRHAVQPSSPLPSMPSSSSVSIQQQQQRRRRRNAASNAGTSSAQSGTSILRFDTAGNNSVEGGGSSVGILSGLKPSTVAYAVETNERLPVNVNVGMPSVGMEYYSYHQHHQQHHPHPHPHMSMPYVPSEHTVGYYATQSHPHPHQTTANQSPPPPPPPPTTATTTHDHHYVYNDGKDEDLDEEDGDEDASGDIDGPQIENQRQQHPTYDPHSHPHHAYAPPPPWPTEPPGAHARV